MLVNVTQKKSGYLKRNTTAGRVPQRTRFARKSSREEKVDVYLKMVNKLKGPQDTGRQKEENDKDKVEIDTLQVEIRQYDI